MPNLSSLVKQLKQERDRVKRELSGLEAALTAFASAYSGKSPAANGGRCQRSHEPRLQPHSDVGLRLEQNRGDSIAMVTCDAYGRESAV